MAKPQFEFNPTPPSHAPLQPTGLMSDPLSMSLALLLPQMLSQLAGPGMFLPEQMQGQNTADQFRGMNYRRDTLNTAFTAARMGDADVSRKIMGAVTAMTGSTTAMTQQQSDFYAGIANNPIVKGLLSSVVGPENLEGIMFGKRGDPSALAAATSRIGFFRRDALGGDRMSAQSMEQFTQGLHGTLYGEGANIDDMRGLMAGQTGQLMEHMFQRGTLPQSIGALSPADRVKAISQNRDDAIIERVAREFAHREMMKDDSYASKTEQEQKIDLEARMPEFRDRIDKTFNQIDEFDKRRDRLSPEQRDEAAQELERSEEYKALATNVDAKRVGQTLKDYAGAVGAVREIFGDNGNTNAPMSQLLAALEHLSNGAVGQMKPAQVENVLRQMRLAAKDTGIGFEQMAQFSAQMSAYGDTLGISKPATVLNTLTSMTMLKSMEETGAFSGNRFGQMTKSEALEEVGKRTQRAETSPMAKTLAAVARAVSSNADKYAGTEAEKMLEAMNNPEQKGVYTYQGKSYNLAEMRPEDIMAKFASAGGDLNMVQQLYYDQNTAQFTPRHLFPAIQAAEMKMLSQFTVNSDVQAAAERNDKGTMRRVLGGRDDKEFDTNRDQFLLGVSGGVQEAIMDAATKMDQKDIPAHLQKRLPEIVQQELVNRGMKPEDAAREAAGLTKAIFGAESKDQIDELLKIQGRLGSFIYKNIGTYLSAEAGIQNAVPDFNTRQVDNQERAKRFSNVARGNESSIFARIGTVLDKMGGGQQYDLQKMSTEILGILKTTDIEAAYAPELAETLARVGGEYADATLDEKEVAAVVNPALADPNDKNAMTALKKLARVDDSTKVVADDVVKQKLMAKEDLAAFYKSQTGKTLAAGPEAREKAVNELMTKTGAIAAAGVLGKDEKTMDQVVTAARKRAYTAAGDTDEEIEANETRRQSADKIFEAIKNGRSVDAVEEGVTAMAQSFLGGKADPALVRQMKAAALGTEGDEDNIKQLETVKKSLDAQVESGGITKEQAGVAMKMLESLRDAKKVPSGVLSSTPEGRLRDDAGQQQQQQPPSKNDPQQSTKEKSWLESFFGAFTAPATAEETPDKPTKKEKKKRTRPDVDELEDTAATRKKDSARSDPTGVEQIAAEIARQVARAVHDQRQSAGGKDNRLTVEGTLRLQNMREGVLAATGTPPQQTPSGGAPVYA